MVWRIKAWQNLLWSIVCKLFVWIRRCNGSNVKGLIDRDSHRFSSGNSTNLSLATSIYKFQHRTKVRLSVAPSNVFIAEYDSRWNKFLNLLRSSFRSVAWFFLWLICFVVLIIHAVLVVDFRSEVFLCFVLFLKRKKKENVKKSEEIIYGIYVY